MPQLSTTAGEREALLTGTVKSVKVRLRERHVSTLVCPSCGSSLKYVGARTWRCERQNTDYRWNATTLTYDVTSMKPVSTTNAPPRSLKSLPQRKCGGLLNWDEHTRRWKCIVCGQSPPRSRRQSVWQIVGTIESQRGVKDTFIGFDKIMWAILRRYLPYLTKQIIIDKLGTPWALQTPEAWAAFKDHLKELNEELVAKSTDQRTTMALAGHWHYDRSGQATYFIAHDVTSQAQPERKREEEDNAETGHARTVSWIEADAVRLKDMIVNVISSQREIWALSTYARNRSGTGRDSSPDLIMLRRKVRDHEIRIVVSIGKRYGVGYRWWLDVDKQRVLPREARVFGKNIKKRHFTCPHTKNWLEGNRDILLHLISSVEDAIVYRESTRRTQQPF